MREAGILSRYIKAGGVVPANLVIRLSATMIDGAAPKSWPITSGVHKHTTPPANQICPAPKQGNVCGPCRKCWDKTFRMFPTTSTEGKHIQLIEQNPSATTAAQTISTRTLLHWKMELQDWQIAGNTAGRYL
jgi:hypothetical protein